MKEDLKITLTNWRDDKRKTGMRNISIKKTPFDEGEYLIIVSESLKVNVGNKTKDIKVERVFQTFNQSGSIELANGDIYRAEQITNIVSIEFFKLYSDTIQELFLNLEGDYTEFNPL